MQEVDRVIRKSGFAIPVPDGEAAANELDVIVNNVADLAEAKRKGFVTGSTFFLKGSTVHRAALQKEGRPGYKTLPLRLGEIGDVVDYDVEAVCGGFAVGNRNGKPGFPDHAIDFLHEHLIGSRMGLPV